MDACRPTNRWPVYDFLKLEKVPCKVGIPKGMHFMTFLMAWEPVFDDSIPNINDESYLLLDRNIFKKKQIPTFPRLSILFCCWNAPANPPQSRRLALQEPKSGDRLRTAAPTLQRWGVGRATLVLRQLGKEQRGSVEKGVKENQYGYGSIPIHTIFSGMNIHLPAILMFTRGIGFWPIPIWGFVGASAYLT